MIDIRKLNIEYKAAAVFGVGSFVLSVIISIFSGNTAGVILVRSMIFAVIFCAIGFSSLFVMKRYVPEFYEIFNSGISGQAPGPDAEGGEESAEGDDSGASAGGNADLEESAGTSLATENADNAETEAALGTIDDVSPSGSADKEQEKMFKYEPEIAAQAIRTMMKKDEK